MKKIEKHELKTQIPSQEIKLPVGSVILCALSRYGIPTIWVSVDDQQLAKETRNIVTMHTGIPIDMPDEQFSRLRHLGTYHDDAWGNAFSIFEEMPEPKRQEMKASVTITQGGQETPV